MQLNLRSNSSWAAAEVVISGLSLFVLYKFVVTSVGVEGLGLWSLVLATTSLARFGDLGAAAGLSRFVAKALAQGDRRRAAVYVETAFLVNLVLFAAIGLALYWPLNAGLAWVIPANMLAQGRDLLPFAILSFALLNLSAALLSGVIGAQRSNLKSMIVIASVVAQVAVVAATIKPWGLLAMAWGQIAQFAFTIVTARLAFLRLVRDGGACLPPCRFDRSALIELVGFGAKLQLTNLISFAFEPLMKFVISATAGLATLGLFEMAYRMVMQVRHVIAAPLQTILPAFVHLDETDPDKTQALYENALANAVVGAAISLGGIAILAPVVSLLWLSKCDGMFWLFSVFCCCGSFLNVVAVPAYLLGISRDYMAGNLLGNAIISFVFPALAFAVATATRIEWSAAAILTAGIGVGGVVTSIANCSKFNVRLLPNAKSLALGLRGRTQQLTRLIGCGSQI